MGLSLASVLSTIAMLGRDAPAYKALFDQVVGLFDADDQEKLKASYADALKDAEAAHKAAQSI